MFENQLRHLRDAQERDVARMQTILNTAQARSEGHRDLTEAETSEFDSLTADCNERGARIKELTEREERERNVADANRSNGASGSGNGAYLPTQRSGYDMQTRVGWENGPYTPESSRNRGTSYFRDLYRAQKGDYAAMERLRDNAAHRQTYTLPGSVQERAISTVNGAGGEFVPPLWLEQQFIEFVRAGRVTAERLTNDLLPEGTDSINIPKVTGGTATSIQGTQNTPIIQTDMTTTSIQSQVFTVAGGQTVSLQLIEQSPLNIDKVIMTDLARAYGKLVDQLVITGTGTGGQPTGLLNVGGINTVTVTSAVTQINVTAAGSLYPAIGNVVQQVQTSRFLPPDAIVMHPRRFQALSIATDGNGRPLILPDAGQGGSQNAIGMSMAGVPAQGAVGYMFGLPVYTDANIPTNLGAGTNQDVIIVARFEDAYLWEGQVRAQAFEQTYANQLSLFIRLYNYVSLQCARYPQAIGVVTGAGLTPPAF